MHRIWHVGLAVPDLTAATAELGELFDLTWRPPVARSLTIDVPGGVCRGGPLGVGVWVGLPGPGGGVGGVVGTGEGRG
ncbi:hypothetical protein ACWEP2_41200, partial [Streptomyces sp. NPDC004279]